MLREQTPKDAPAQPGQDMLRRTVEDKLHEERPQGLEAAVGLQSWKSGNLWQPTAPLPAQRDPQELLSPKHNQHRGQLCMEPNSFMTGSGASLSFLCGVFSLYFLFYMTVLHYSSFPELQKFCQVDLFLIMRPICPQRP